MLSSKYQDPATRAHAAPKKLKGPAARKASLLLLHLTLRLEALSLARADSLLVNPRRKQSSLHVEPLC